MMCFPKRLFLFLSSKRILVTVMGELFIFKQVNVYFLITLFKKKSSCSFINSSAFILSTSLRLEKIMKIGYMLFYFIFHIILNRQLYWPPFWNRLRYNFQISIWKWFHSSILNRSLDIIYFIKNNNRQTQSKRFKRMCSYEPFCLFLGSASRSYAGYSWFALYVYRLIGANIFLVPRLVLAITWLQ